MSEMRFINARVVTRNSDFLGGVVLEGGKILAAETGLGASGACEDFEGDFLIPGLVDLHTDNLERHYEPRPGVQWDALGAVLSHDSQVVCAGITTVFDSLSLHGTRKGFDRGAALAPMLEGLNAACEEDILRADHFLHLRCEVTNPRLIDDTAMHIDHPRLRLISVMDHSPGQGQLRNMTEERLRKFAVALGWSEEEIASTLDDWMSGRTAHLLDENRKQVTEMARAKRLPLASHDDETVRQVADAAAAGAVISEFPVTLEAAAEAHRRGLTVMMGAPNLIRGGSHSGNVGAGEIATSGYLDSLASDYMPMSCLRALFCLTEAPFGFSLAEAVATVSLKPAEVVGLFDRGEIAPGKRADLVRVTMSREGWPVVRAVWREGKRVA